MSLFLTFTFKILNLTIDEHNKADSINNKTLRRSPNTGWKLLKSIVGSIARRPRRHTHRTGSLHTLKRSIFISNYRATHAPFPNAFFMRSSTACDGHPLSLVFRVGVPGLIAALIIWGHYTRVYLCYCSVQIPWKPSWGFNLKMLRSD